MPSPKSKRPRDLIEQVSDLVAAYVVRNHVEIAQLPHLIAMLHAALDQLAAGGAIYAAISESQRPTAAQIRASITDAVLISFIDGKPYKTLKRHIGLHGLTPDAYKERFGLPSSYPIVAPSYSARRAVIARQIGLGKRSVSAEGEQRR